MSHTPGPWITMTHYGAERLWCDDSDRLFSVVLPENGSYPEDIICEVWGTEHDDRPALGLLGGSPTLQRRRAKETKNG